MAMILACSACDSRYDVAGHATGQQFRCRCGQLLTLGSESAAAGLLTCPRCAGPVAPGDVACTHCAAPLLLRSCPRCLSRVFHEHKHCPACGAELALAAVGDANPERPCPRCVTAMSARPIGDLVVDECGTCHGVFLDHVAIQRVVTDRQQARADAVLAAVKRADVPKQPAGPVYIKCPVCAVLMNRRQFSAGAGVIIDVCKAHGAFFDPGELPRIIEFVMNGGLEQAQRKELERARDDLRRQQDSARFSAMMAARSSTTAAKSAARQGGAGDAFIDLLVALWR